MQANTALTQKTLTSLLLVAGSSSRFGNQNKLLAELNGIPVCVHALHALLNSSTDNILIITGYEHELVQATLTKHCNLSRQKNRVAFAHNPSFKDGMASSIVTGVSNAGGADAVIVCLGDMPGVSPVVIDALHSAWIDDSAFSAYIPEYDERQGNPVLLTRKLFDDMLSLTGDLGARGLLRKYAQSVLAVPVSTGMIHRDIDVTSDLLLHKQ